MDDDGLSELAPTVVEVVNLVVRGKSWGMLNKQGARP